MKLVQLVLALAAPAAALRSVAFQGESLSPVTRVVELLQGMSKRIEADGKKEEDLYETYVCWAKTVISQKTASNAKATSRIDSLEAYLADLDAGRVELTTERQDLEKEIAGLTEDIETAEALRAKEKEDYEAAKGEMDAAIAAMEDAIEVLKEGMGKEELLAVSSRLGEGYRARAGEAQNLARAVEISGAFLSKGDALFLQRVLTGEVPQKDWKKLNRKATFKMSYKARSGKILETLEKMLFTFKSTLSETEGKEEKAVELHNTLMKNKNSQKDAASDALAKMEVEGAAKGLTKTEANDEIDALKTQRTNDEGFITQTEKDLETKKGEWKDRKAIRVGELEAISKAISILHSDDARDLFKKSLSSQGYLFLQEKSASLLASRRSLSMKDAAGVLGRAARASKDTRLALLASRLSRSVPSHFAAVVTAIDNMIGTLEKEEETELGHKEDCEQTRADDLRDAALYSRTMDDLTDTIDSLDKDIKDLDDEIKDKDEEINEISRAMKEAMVNRDDENQQWLISNKEDTDAAALVQDAIDVLEKFYSNVGTFVQKGKQPEVVAGEAPPPPPATWEAPYSGKQEENTGVVSILNMIKTDIEKDQAKAKQTEDDAQTAFDTFKKESEDEIKLLQGDISDMEGTISDKEGEIVGHEGDRDSNKGLLKTVMKKLKDEAPGCDFLLVNYDTRVKNRQIEIDGLKKAKAILSGASFE